MALTTISGEVEAQPLNDNFSNLNQRINDFAINVKDPEYGATGDGVTDDTIAVQAAIDAAIANGGGLVYFPSGTYLISTALDTITTNGIYISGQGIGSTEIRFSSDTANLFTFGDESESTTIGAGVSNLTIRCNDTKTAGIISTFVNCQRYFVEKVEVINAFTTFQLGSDTDASSNFCVITDIIGNNVNGGTGVDIKGVNGIHLTRIQLNSESAENCYGIKLPSINNMDTLLIDSCLFQRFTYGFVSLASAGITQNIFVTNTIFDTIYTYPLIFQLAGTGILTRVHFTQCWFNSVNEDGVIVSCDATSTIDGVYFSSNTRIVVCAKRGFVINSQYPINVELDNCIISGCSLAGSGLYSAFVTAASATKWRITNCTIGEEGVTTSNQDYGIAIGANNDNYEILNNVLTGNVSGSIDDAGGTFTAKRISNNVGFNPVGILIPPAIPATTVAQVNTFSFPVEVYIYLGTVAGIAKNGTGIAGMTSGSIILAPSETIAITYSSAPTWTWFGI